VHVIYSIRAHHIFALHNETVAALLCHTVYLRITYVKSPAFSQVDALLHQESLHNCSKKEAPSMLGSSLSLSPQLKRDAGKVVKDELAAYRVQAVCEFDKAHPSRCGYATQVNWDTK